MQKTKANVSRKFIHKMLLITLFIAVIIFIVAYLRNMWLNMGLEKVHDKQQIAALNQKVDSLDQRLQMASAHNPVDVHGYTMSQVKDAFLLVRTADISLQHGQDVLVAKQLLQLASEHLANLQGVKIEQARSVLAADQAKLAAVQIKDMQSLQDKFTILDKLINVLPVYRGTAEQLAVAVPTTKHPSSAQTSQPWYQAICNMFYDLKTVVRIRKKSDHEVSVTDVDVARAQFKLLVEQLRWAAFYNNNEVYQRSISNAQELLSSIFDMNSESVQKFSSILQELQKMQLNTEIPSIQNSVNALQAILVG